MPNGLNRELKNDAGAKFSAAALTDTDNSESISLNGLDVIGLAIDLPTVGGTSPTLDIKVEVSFDGTAWVEFPEDVNSETQAAFAQITAAGDVSKYWTNPFATIRNQDLVADQTYPVVRFVFTTTGTSESFTFTRIQIIARSFMR